MNFSAHWKLTLKVVITIGLLGWLTSFVFQSESISLVIKANPLLVVSACLIHFLVYIILLVRWKLVLGIYYQLSYRVLSSSFFIGLFANNFLPSSVGGDVVRASYLYRQGLAISELLTSSILDRFVGVVTLVLCVVSSTLFLANSLVHDLPVNEMLALGSALLIAPLVLYIVLRLVFMKAEWVKNFAAIYNILAKLKQLAAVVKQQPQRLLLAVVLSITSTVGVIFCYYVIGLSLGIGVSLQVLFVAVPISFFVASLPISIGGLGVREGTIIYLLSRFEIPVEHGVALTAVYLCVLTLVTAPCGLLILRKSQQINTDELLADKPH